MRGLRFLKVFKDFYAHKGKTLLVVLAVAIGGTGAGTVLMARAVLDREMEANYEGTEPAAAELETSDPERLSLPGGREAVNALAGNSGIVAAERAGSYMIRIRTGENEWRQLRLFVRDDYENLGVNGFRRETGDWPPPDGAILIERAALGVAGAAVGSSVTISIPGGKTVAMKVAGTVHDPGLAPAWMEGLAYGYVSPETMRNLGLPPFNRVLLRLESTVKEASVNPVSNGHEAIMRFLSGGTGAEEDASGHDGRDPESIEASVHAAAESLERNGLPVSSVTIPPPGEHPHHSQMQAILFLLQSLGLLSLFLSCILVVNLMASMLSGQVRQIAVMKAVGARTAHITVPYLLSAGVLGACSLLISIPLSVSLARGYAGFAAGMLNFVIADASVPLPVFLVSACTGMLLPVIAALYPVLKGCGITVKAGLSDYGIGSEEPGKRTGMPVTGREAADGTVTAVRDGNASGGRTDFLNRIVPCRPLLLSLRNAFRKRGRMLLTTGIIAVGGAVFISALNTGASITKTIENSRERYRYDIEIVSPAFHHERMLTDAVSGIESIRKAEAWLTLNARARGAGAPSGEKILIFAGPADTGLLDLRMTEGRWFSPGEGDAAVVNRLFTERIPGTRVGGRITLEVGGIEKSFTVTGIADHVGESTVFLPVGSAADFIDTGTGIRVNTLRIVTENADEVPVKAVQREIERKFQALGIPLSVNTGTNEFRKVMGDHFLIIVSFLMMMAVFIIAVGGLGLASVTSVQAAERTRETGIMRAVGAGGRVVAGMILLENLAVGVISWIAAALLSFPVSVFLGSRMIEIFLHVEPELAFEPAGYPLWLGLVLVLSCVSALIPARRAIRKEVKECLAYE